MVSNQELVAQTAYPTTVTENDTYDTTNYNSITVNVSGGGGSSFATVSEFNYAYDYLTLLVSIDIPDGVETIGDAAFYDCTSLTSITIPSSVTSIGESAFQDCSALTSITIPSSVTSIGDYAFRDCSTLTSITFESTTPPDLDGDLGIPTTCVIRVPQGTLSDYTSAYNYPDPSEYTYEEY